jgi:uncharacterized membrane protein YkvA (DUF1232 family)
VVSVWLWLLVAGGALVATAVALSVYLHFSDRREEARALAGFVPHLLLLCLRLLRDPRVPRRRKALLVGLALYLAMPLDLIPASPLDDALLVLLVLPLVLRGNAGLIEEHWPGPSSSLGVVLRLAGTRKA